jgi:HAD superfamily hydrolase (TIGR01509 family)
MPALRAIIFDVDGTLADTEAVHLAAFNAAFEARGLPWRWSTHLYRELLDVSGGKERLKAYWEQHARGTVPADRIDALVEELHREKTARYTAAIASREVHLRPGVERLMDEALAQGLRLAIATTTTPANIEALLAPRLGAAWRSRFAAIEDAATAAAKKPHPQAYVQAVAKLGLPATACLAVEDSENGCRSARAAGVPYLVTPSPFTEGQDFAGALAVVPDLAATSLAELTRLHAAAAARAVAGASARDLAAERTAP